MSRWITIDLDTDQFWRNMPRNKATALLDDIRRSLASIDAKNTETFTLIRDTRAREAADNDKLRQVAGNCGTIGALGEIINGYVEKLEDVCR